MKKSIFFVVFVVNWLIQTNRLIVQISFCPRYLRAAKKLTADGSFLSSEFRKALDYFPVLLYNMYIIIFFRSWTMKKIFVFLAALGCITALSACGSASSAKYTPPDGSLDKCTLRFSWWGGDDRHEATLAAIKLWEQKHPDITITPEYGGWDGWTEKVSSQISGGTAPDVMQINYDWLVSLSPDGGGFYDLGLLTDRLDLSAFDDEVLSFGRMNGKLNAVTVSVSGFLLS